MEVRKLKNTGHDQRRRGTGRNLLAPSRLLERKGLKRVLLFFKYKYGNKGRPARII